MPEPSEIKAGLIQQAMTVIREKPTTEVLLFGILGAVIYAVPYVLNRMDAQIDKVELSHKAATKEVVDGFQAEQEASRAEHRADRAEFRAWMNADPRRVHRRVDHEGTEVGARDIGGDDGT